MSDSNCIFCKIISGEVPASKIVENEKYLAFLDISQFTPGHTLVVPKAHFEIYNDVPNVGEYFEFMTKVSDHYKNDLGFKYVDLLVFGRMVTHSHIHLVPHNGDDETWKSALSHIGELQTNQERRPSKEEMNSIREKFSFEL